jgi:hypothetical protein
LAIGSIHSDDLLGLVEVGDVALVVDAAFEVAGAGTEPGAAGEEGEVDAVAVETAGFGVETYEETNRSVNRSFFRKPRKG